MIAHYAKRSEGEQFEEASPSLKSGVWVNATKVDKIELAELTKKYQLDGNILRDVHDSDELPRLEFSNDAAYVFLRLPHLARSGRVGAMPLLCVVKDHQFFTISTAETISLDLVMQSTVPKTTSDTHVLLLGVIASSVAEFEELITHTARSITDTANRLKTHEVTNHDFIHFVTVEHNLNACKMNLESTLTMVMRLRDNTREFLTEEDFEALDDVRLHIQQLLAAITSHTQSVASIRNAYSTIANNKLNQRMKTLTILTVLITLPNVVYGMYGMNVTLPFEKEPWAYFGIVSITVVLTALVFIVAKARGYFK
ncbi:MAG TPA: magnesium transporter CorA family protein [Candidatus Saccharimonadales bacterium]